MPSLYRKDLNTKNFLSYCNTNNNRKVYAYNFNTLRLPNPLNVSYDIPLLKTLILLTHRDGVWKKKGVKDVISRPPTVQDICDKNTNYVSAYQYTYCDKTITQKALNSDFIKYLKS